MRGRFTSYLTLQLKRAWKLLPQMLLVTLLLGLGAALVGQMLSERSASDEAKQKVEIGVVCGAEDTYLQFGLLALERMDSSRLSIRLRQMEEQEADAALRAGQLTAYARIPEGFVEGMISGDHRPITYVTTAEAVGFGTIAAEEIVTEISRLLLETENAVYGAQAFAADRIDGVNPYAVGQALVEQYMETILKRDRLFEVETVGAADSLSLERYYLCGLAVALLLLRGIACSPLFSRRSKEMSGLLNANGLRAAGQTLAEFAAFCALMLAALLCIGLLAGVALPRLGVRLPGLQGLTSGERAQFCLRLIAAGVALSAMEFLLYELSPGAVGGVLLQFINAVAQGYVSGCFYPSSFLPEGMRRLGEMLPAGVAMRVLKDGLQTGGSPWMLAALLGDTLLFLLLAAAVRRQRLRV